MKKLIPLFSLLVLAACVPNKSIPAHPDTFSPNVLSLLQQDLSNATLIVDGVERNIDIRWRSRSDAQMCQRQLDIYLGDHQIGAFVNPSDQASVIVVAEKLKLFLKQRHVIENHIWNEKPGIIDKY